MEDLDQVENKYRECLFCANKGKNCKFCTPAPDWVKNKNPLFFLKNPNIHAYITDHRTGLTNKEIFLDEFLKEAEGDYEEMKIDPNIPIWHKYALTIEEASRYFGIGENKLREIAYKDTNAILPCFTLKNGSKTLIKRSKFESHLDHEIVI